MSPEHLLIHGLANQGSAILLQSKVLIKESYILHLRALKERPQRQTPG